MHNRKEERSRTGACLIVGLALAFGSVYLSGQSGTKESSAQGTGLTAQRIAQADANGTTIFTYVLKARGYPAGAKVGFLATNLANVAKATPERPVVVGSSRATLTVDAEGNVLGVDGRPYTVAIRGPSAGETYLITIVGLQKNKLQRFTRVTPIPLEASGGPCHIAAILMAPHGAEYQMDATGFEPGEKVSVRLEPDGKTKEAKANKDGSWTLKVGPKIGDAPEGMLEVTATAQSCQVRLALPWKKP